MFPFNGREAEQYHYLPLMPSYLYPPPQEDQLRMQQATTDSWSARTSTPAPKPDAAHPTITQPWLPYYCQPSAPFQNAFQQQGPVDLDQTLPYYLAPTPPAISTQTNTPIRIESVSSDADSGVASGCSARSSEPIVTDPDDDADPIALAMREAGLSPGCADDTRSHASSSRPHSTPCTVHNFPILTGLLSSESAKPKLTSPAYVYCGVCDKRFECAMSKTGGYKNHMRSHVQKLLSGSQDPHPAITRWLESLREPILGFRNPLCQVCCSRLALALSAMKGHLTAYHTSSEQLNDCFPVWKDGELEQFGLASLAHVTAKEQLPKPRKPKLPARLFPHRLESGPENPQVFDDRASSAPLPPHQQIETEVKQEQDVATSFSAPSSVVPCQSDLDILDQLEAECFGFKQEPVDPEAALQAHSASPDGCLSANNAPSHGSNQQMTASPRPETQDPNTAPNPSSSPDSGCSTSAPICEARSSITTPSPKPETGSNAIASPEPMQSLTIQDLAAAKILQAMSRASQSSAVDPSPAKPSTALSPHPAVTEDLPEQSTNVEGVEKHEGNGESEEQADSMNVELEPTPPTLTKSPPKSSHLLNSPRMLQTEEMVAPSLSPQLPVEQQEWKEHDYCAKAISPSPLVTKAALKTDRTKDNLCLSSQDSPEAAPISPPEVRSTSPPDLFIESMQVVIDEEMPDEKPPLLDLEVKPKTDPPFTVHLSHENFGFEQESDDPIRTPELQRSNPKSLTHFTPKQSIESVAQVVVAGLVDAVAEEIEDDFLPLLTGKELEKATIHGKWEDFHRNTNPVEFELESQLAQLYSCALKKTFKVKRLVRMPGSFSSRCKNRKIVFD